MLLLENYTVEKRDNACYSCIMAQSESGIVGEHLMMST